MRRKVGENLKNFHILEPLLFTMGTIVLLLGMLRMPNIVPFFFPEDRLGHGYAVLYPTYVCLQILRIGGPLIILLLGVVEFIWWKKMNKLMPSFISGITKLCIVTFILPAGLILVMIGSDEVQEPYKAIKADMENYRLGNFNTYYGPLKPLGKEVMDGPYYSKDGSINEFTQIWEIEGVLDDKRMLRTSSSIISSLGVANTVLIKEGEEYKVTYLPETSLICDVEPFDRWSDNNKTTENDVFSNPKDGWKDDELMNCLKSETMVGSTQYNLSEIIERDPDCKIIYANVNLDGDKNLDYMVFMYSPQENSYGMFLIRNFGDSFELSVLSDYLYNETATFSILTSTSYYMHDIRIEFKDGSEAVLFKYNGREKYEEVKKK